MKVIALAAVGGGGKTAVANELAKRLPNALSLHFDDYDFEGAVEDFRQWAVDGADYQVWNLSPLLADIARLGAEGKCEWLILDFPFAYLHEAMRPHIHQAIFIDTPLDIALARRILRDQAKCDGQQIREGLAHYLTFARPAFIQMQRDVLPSSDAVVDGSQSLEAIADEILQLIQGGGYGLVNGKRV